MKSFKEYLNESVKPKNAFGDIMFVAGSMPTDEEFDFLETLANKQLEISGGVTIDKLRSLVQKDPELKKMSKDVDVEELLGYIKF